MAMNPLSFLLVFGQGLLFIAGGVVMFVITTGFLAGNEESMSYLQNLLAAVGTLAVSASLLAWGVIWLAMSFGKDTPGWLYKIGVGGLVFAIGYGLLIISVLTAMHSSKLWARIVVPLIGVPLGLLVLRFLYRNVLHPAKTNTAKGQQL